MTTDNRGLLEGFCSINEFVIIFNQPGSKKREKPEMQVITPLKEVVDIIKEAGGEELKLCYQCGLCKRIVPR